MDQDLLGQCVLNDVLNLLNDLYLDYKQRKEVVKLVNIYSLSKGIFFLKTILSTIEFQVQDYIIENKIEINCLNNRVLNIVNHYLIEFIKKDKISEINICCEILGNKNRFKIYGISINNLLEKL